LRFYYIDLSKAMDTAGAALLIGQIEAFRGQIERFRAKIVEIRVFEFGISAENKAVVGFVREFCVGTAILILLCWEIRERTGWESWSRAAESGHGGPDRTAVGPD
jgi:hypothetical protein